MSMTDGVVHSRREAVEVDHVDVMSVSKIFQFSALTIQFEAHHVIYGILKHRS